MIEEITLTKRVQTPTPPNEWCYQDQGENFRYFTKRVLLGKNAEPWPECTDEQKQIYDALTPQRPTPPNEWLYKQDFVTDPETGETEEVRSEWCTQTIFTIPDTVPPTEWYKYFYKECTQAEKDQWEHDHPQPEIIVPDEGKEPVEPEEAAES